MTAERITGKNNPLLSHVRKLRDSRAYRRECGEFMAEGWKLLDEALKWYPRLKTVLFCEGAELPPLPPEVRAVELPASLLDSLSAMKTPQGVLFTAALPPVSELELRAGMLLLDRIQDPGNLGTILRTADAFGIPVVLTNGCADPFSEKTIRASMGAVLRTPVQSGEMEKILAQCAEKHIPIAATALTPQAEDLRAVPLREMLTVIGSEGQGICQTLLEASQRQIIIPMQPRCESLNAAIAAAIVMWEMQ